MIDETIALYRTTEQVNEGGMNPAKYDVRIVKSEWESNR